MIKNEKIKIINNLINILSKKNTIYLIDTSKMQANELSILRKYCFEYNVQLTIVKNKLLKIAINSFKDKKFKYFYNFLQGNTSVMTPNINNIVGNIPAIIIKKYKDIHKSQLPIIKAAYTNDIFYIGNINVLLNIKSKEELIYNIIISLQEKFLYLIYNIEYNKNILFLLFTKILNNKN